MLNNFIKYFKKIYLPNNSTLIIALSGGSDSVALTHLLGLTKNIHTHNLVIAHINHNFRDAKEHEKDIDLVKEIASSYSLKLHIETISKDEYENSNIEATARLLRYNILNDIASQYENSYVVLAHTKDDQIETTYMRFLALSGYEGLAGIKERRDVFIRPLLNFSKANLESFLLENNFRWCLDITNNDPKYLRNLARQNLVKLNKIDAGFSKALLNLNSKMKEVEDSINFYIEEAWQFVWLEENAVVYSLDLIESYPALIQKKLLLKGCNLLGRGKLAKDYRLKDSMFNNLVYSKNNPIVFKNKLFTLHRQKRLLILSLTL